MPNRCSADTTRPPEISVFFMVSYGCLTTEVRGCSQVVLGGCWESLVSFEMHSDRRFICFLDVSAVAPVDCVTHLYHIAPVFQLFSTGSWAPSVLVRELHAYRLTRRDGLQWIGSPVEIVLLPLSLLVPGYQFPCHSGA